MMRPFDAATATLADVEQKIDEDVALYWSCVFAGHDGEQRWYADELDSLRRLRFDLQCVRDREAGT